MKKSIATFIFYSCFKIMHAQVTASDCTGAVYICTNGSFSVAPSGSGSVIDFSTSSNISNPVPATGSVIPPGGDGCLYSGELNPTWMIIDVQSTGTLEFSLGAGTGPGAQSGCYDWVLWAYGSATCNGINSNALAPLRCCWNNHCTGGTGLASAANLPAGGFTDDFGAPLNVNCGDKFIMCFSNYSSVTTLVPLNFFGSAVVSCTAGPGIPVVTVSGNTMICQGQTTTLTASGASTYTWSTGANSSTTTLSPSVTASYTVSGDNGTCIGQSVVTVSVSPCTSVNETEMFTEAGIHPIPNAGNFDFYLKGSNVAELVVFNNAGQIVHRNKLTEGNNIIHMVVADGIYYYHVLTDKGRVKVGKLIVSSES